MWALVGPDPKQTGPVGQAVWRPNGAIDKHYRTAGAHVRCRWEQTILTLLLLIIVASIDVGGRFAVSIGRAGRNC